jgi:hypothetical protein
VTGAIHPIDFGFTTVDSIRLKAKDDELTSFQLVKRGLDQFPNGFGQHSLQHFTSATPPIGGVARIECRGVGPGDHVTISELQEKLLGQFTRITGERVRSA